MTKLITTVLYADLGLDVPIKERFRVVATGDGLCSRQFTMTDKARRLATDYISALAIDDGATLMDDIMKKQFEECPTGFCPDIKKAYEEGHGCVMGGGEAHKNDSIKMACKNDVIFDSDPEANWLKGLGLAFHMA